MDAATQMRAQYSVEKIDIEKTSIDDRIALWRKANSGTDSIQIQTTLTTIRPERK